MDEEQYRKFLENTAYEHSTDHAQPISHYKTEYQEAHPAQSELVAWLQRHKAQNGIIGKRAPIERTDVEQHNTQEIAARRKVVVKYKNRHA